VLHLVLVLARLGRDHEPGARPGRHPGPRRGRILGRGLGRTLGQGLFDAFCRDLDDNLREMGVGDLAVSREMRRFGEVAGRRRIATRSPLPTTGSLRRRWHAISLGPSVSMTGRPGWRAMRARRQSASMPRRRTHS
jgi:hypothetical protein